MQLYVNDETALATVQNVVMRGHIVTLCVLASSRASRDKENSRKGLRGDGIIYTAQVQLQSPKEEKEFGSWGVERAEYSHPPHCGDTSASSEISFITCQPSFQI